MRNAKTCFMFFTWIYLCVSNAGLAKDFAPATPRELIASLNEANRNNQNDIIDLGGKTFLLNMPFYAATALPIIGADLGHTVDIRNGILDKRTGDLFRILAVGDKAMLFINSVEFRNGNASSRIDSDSGGAILVNNGGSLIVRNSRFRSSIARLNGGAIAALDLAVLVRIDSSVFEVNKAGDKGGAISIAGSRTLFRNEGNLFIANLARTPDTNDIYYSGSNTSPTDPLKPPPTDPLKPPTR